MTAITLDPNLNNLKLKTHQSQQIVEKIDGLITVYKNGQIERPQIMPRVGCSLPPELGLTCQDAVIDKLADVWARIYIPTAAANNKLRLPLLVYFHGGGFCLGSPSWICYHEFLAKLAADANCAVVSVNYRLAPEHRLPIPYEDGAKTLNWLANQRSIGTHWLNRCDPSGIFLAGDSAGANIAYHVAKRWVNSSSSPSICIKGLVLLQPFFGGEARTASEICSTAGQHQPPPRSALTLAAADAYWRMALPLGANRDHPWCNPRSEDVFAGGGQPLLRVMVGVAEMDILRDRNFDFCEGLAGAAAAGGHTVEKVVSKGVGHAFQILDKSALSQARVRELINLIKNFIKSL